MCVAVALLLGAACGSGVLRQGQADGGRDGPTSDPVGEPAAAVDECVPPVWEPGTCCGGPLANSSPVSPDSPCTFTVPLLSPDPNDLGVYLDKNLVPKDATDGWQFDATASSVVFSGTYCDKVVAEGPSAEVQVFCTCLWSPQAACIP